MKELKRVGTLRECLGEEAIKRMNERMRQVHKDYIRKARQSELEASKVILTD